MERHVIFINVIEQLAQLTNKQRQAVAERAEVSPGTLYNWVFGGTIAPRLSTLVPVAEALGFELVLQRKAQLRRVA